MTEHVLCVEELRRTFRSGEETVNALDGVSLRFEPGRSYAIVGPSGSGKTTLLKCAGLLMTPTDGRVLLDDRDVTDLPDRERSRLRNETFGYVLQDFAVIDDDTVYENIIIPLQYSSIPKKEWKERAAEAVGKLGIGDKLKRKAGTLSGGEKQRLAIARAIVCGQPILLADEPTGSLDTENKEKVIDLLGGLCKEERKTLIVVTHDEVVASRCDTVILLRDGKTAK